MRLLYISASIFGILLLCANVHAGRTSTQLTKENIGEQPFTFTIEVTGRAKDRQGMQFQVTVRPKGKRLAGDSRYVASLHLKDRKNLIASCPVASTTKDGTLFYSFFITKPYLNSSSFMFGEEVGREEEWTSGRYFTATLGDFANDESAGKTDNKWIKRARDHVAQDKSLQEKIGSQPYDPKNTRVRKNSDGGYDVELNYGSLAYDTLWTATIEMDAQGKVLKTHAKLSGFE